MRSASAPSVPGSRTTSSACNLYLSATFGLAGFTANDDGGFKVDSSSSGTAFELMVGKEWWVSRDWGLGIAGELMTASLKDKNVPGLTWSAGAAVDSLLGDLQLTGARPH